MIFFIKIAWLKRQLVGIYIQLLKLIARVNLILKLSIEIISSKSRRNNLQNGFWRKTLGKNIVYLSRHIISLRGWACLGLRYQNRFSRCGITGTIYIFKVVGQVWLEEHSPLMTISQMAQSVFTFSVVSLVQVSKCFSSFMFHNVLYITKYNPMLADISNIVHLENPKHFCGFHLFRFHSLSRIM